MTAAVARHAVESELFVAGERARCGGNAEDRRLSFLLPLFLLVLVLNIFGLGPRN
jgi:hypothetical protein